MFNINDVIKFIRLRGKIVIKRNQDYNLVSRCQVSLELVQVMCDFIQDYINVMETHVLYGIQG